MGAQKSETSAWPLRAAKAPPYARARLRCAERTRSAYRACLGWRLGVGARAYSAPVACCAAAGEGYAYAHKREEDEGEGGGGEAQAMHRVSCGEEVELRVARVQREVLRENGGEARQEGGGGQHGLECTGAPVDSARHACELLHQQHRRGEERDEHPDVPLLEVVTARARDRAAGTKGSVTRVGRGEEQAEGRHEAEHQEHDDR
eukprot:scaffold26260_cov72-Phaeocystis_antarctica.AAC.3